jgi:hypothetical protein
MLHSVKCGDGTPCADDNGGEEVKSLTAAVVALRSMVSDLQEQVRALTEQPQPYIVPSLRAIRSTVCAHFGISESEVMAPRRGSKAALARKVICHLSRKMTKHSLIAIANSVGIGLHTGTSAGNNEITELRFKDSAFNDEMTRLESALSKPVPTKTASKPCPVSSLPSPASPARAKPQPQSAS